VLRYHIETIGIEVELEVPEAFGRLPREFETWIFRTVQECLTNMTRSGGEVRLQVAGSRSWAGREKIGRS
jgi:signal transduction histidine kinase